MDLHCKLLLYLDKRHYLSDMKDKCKDFIEQLTEKTICKFPPLRYLLEINVMDSLNAYPEVGDLLLKEPLKLQRMCNRTLFACLQAMLNDDTLSYVKSSQVAVTLRLKNIPQVAVPNNPRYFSGLVQFQGLLLSMSKPVSYVYHTVWSCPEECEGNETILHYIPKVQPKCIICKSAQFENSGLRRCGEQVTATFKFNDSLLTRNFTITDDLIHKLKIGARYVINTVVLKKVIEIWEVEEVLPLCAPLTHPIPSDIEELYHACDGSPHKFIYCLASSIGVQICPLNFFMNLKINLLLSLASVEANKATGSNIVHVLAAGYDTGYVGKFMEEAAKLADRKVFLGTSKCAASTSLLGSSGGVFVMPLPLHIYNSKQTSCILSAIESGEITTDTGRVKLQSAVWAQGMDFKKIILFNVASVFGSVSRGDYGEYESDIIDFLLQNAIEPAEVTKDEVEALKDIKTYLDLVSGIGVRLDNETEKLLRNYFLAARRERPKGVSVGSMGALVALCLTSARLCHRSIANIDDAVFAIWLHVSGVPEPRFAPEEYLQTPGDVRKFDKIINNFRDWLEQFTGSLIN